VPSVAQKKNVASATTANMAELVTLRLAKLRRWTRSTKSKPLR